MYVLPSWYILKRMVFDKHSYHQHSSFNATFISTYNRENDHLRRLEDN